MGFRRKNKGVAAILTLALASVSALAEKEDKQALCSIDPSSEEGEKVDDQEEDALKRARPTHERHGDQQKIRSAMRLQDKLLDVFQISRRELCSLKSLREKQFARSAQELTGAPDTNKTDNCEWYTAQEKLDKQARETLEEYKSKVEKREENFRNFRSKVFDANKKLFEELDGDKTLPPRYRESLPDLAREVKAVFDSRSREAYFQKLLAELTQEKERTADQTGALGRRADDLSADRKKCESLGCVADARSANLPRFHSQQDFIRWMTPYALEIQQNSGIPASVIIAQAAVESGYGTSHLFRNGNSAFGHSCWTYGATKTFVFPMADGTTRTVTGTCNRPRPANEGGYYYSFSNPGDSVYAYGYNVMHDPGTQRYYGNARRAARNATPDRPASHDEVINGLGPYAQDQSYRDKLRRVIRENNLNQLDRKKLCKAS